MSNYHAASLPELRNQMEIAQTLGKAHISFVVIPCKSREGFDMLVQHQIKLLGAAALEEEQNQVVTEKPYRCGPCGSTDPTRYTRCNHAGCPDGRDR